MTNQKCNVLVITVMNLLLTVWIILSLFLSIFFHTDFSTQIISVIS